MNEQTERKIKKKHAVYIGIRMHKLSKHLKVKKAFTRTQGKKIKVFISVFKKLNKYVFKIYLFYKLLPTSNK